MFFYSLQVFLFLSRGLDLSRALFPLKNISTKVPRGAAYCVELRSEGATFVPSWISEWRGGGGLTRVYFNGISFPLARRNVRDMSGTSDVFYTFPFSKLTSLCGYFVTQRFFSFRYYFFHLHPCTHLLIYSPLRSTRQP